MGLGDALLHPVWFTQLPLLAETKRAALPLYHSVSGSRTCGSSRSTQKAERKRLGSSLPHNPALQSHERKGTAPEPQCSPRAAFLFGHLCKDGQPGCKQLRIKRCGHSAHMALNGWCQLYDEEVLEKSGGIWDEFKELVAFFFSFLGGRGSAHLGVAVLCGRSPRCCLRRRCAWGCYVGYIGGAGGGGGASVGGWGEGVVRQALQTLCSGGNMRTAFPLVLFLKHGAAANKEPRRLPKMSSTEATPTARL